MNPFLKNLLRSAHRRTQSGTDSAAQEQVASPEKIVFLHVPKCGGTSVDQALERSLGHERQQVVHLDSHASAQAAELLGEDLASYRKKLLLYWMAGRPRYISGHFAFSDVACKHLGRTWCTVTVLREPVARWLSHYFYNKYKTSDHFRIKAPLEAFVETERARGLGNTYTEWFTDGLAPEAIRSDEAVEHAIRTLNKLDIVGVLERLDVFATDCQTRFGVYVPVEHQNQNPRSKVKQHEELTDGVLERIRALCAPDLRVYEATRARIDREGSWLKH